jgi:hypothetical protein
LAVDPHPEKDLEWQRDEKAAGQHPDVEQPQPSFP